MIFIDLETRCTLDLKKIGLYNYAEACEIICTAWARDDEPVQVAPGLPDEVVEQLGITPGAVAAHNAGFEKAVLAARGIQVPWGWWTDTAAMAAHMSLPRKLESLAEALRLPVGKDTAGHRIMLKLSRPKRGWGTSEFWTEEEKPADFAALYEYCRRDVEVMRECYRKMVALPLQEARLLALTGQMNDRGVAVDIASLAPAQALLAQVSAAGEARFKELTGGHGLKSYARAAPALNLPNMEKPTVRRALRDPASTPRVKEALDIYRRLAKSSPAKLEAMRLRASPDGRCRGMLVYAGAERTGRWSGAGVQPQNFPRGLGEGTQVFFDALKAGAVDLVYAEPVGTVADALRGFFTGPFLVGDFAQIEARVLAWLAGQTDLITTFATHGDPYKMMAARIYGVDPKTVTKDQRFMGKQVILGCFSADTPVLTNLGWKRIVDVQPQDMLWDGDGWVSHRGVVCQGEKSVMRWQGIGVTEDHLFWTRYGWVSASQVADESTPLLGSALDSASSAWRATYWVDGEESRPSESLVVATGPTCTTWTRTTFARVRALAATLAPRLLLTSLRRCTGATPTSWPGMTTAPACSTGSPLAWAGATTPDARPTRTTEGAASPSTGLGGRTGGPFSGIWSACQAGMSRLLSSTGSMWTRATGRATSGSPPGARTWQTAAQSLPSLGGSRVWSERCETFDLAHAGPQNRYTILTEAGPIIVHNCGYGMGAEKFRGMLADIYDVEVEVPFAERAIATYRAANGRITAFWRRLEAAVKYVVLTKKSIGIPGTALGMGMTEVGGLHYLWVQLPSGRRLYYCEPEMAADGVRYWGRNLYTGGRWERINGYGGKWAENITQATARDIMAEAMLKLEERGLRLLLTVHDEVVAEDTGLLPIFKEVMLTPPNWAAGLPLDVDFFQSRRYRK